MASQSMNNDDSNIRVVTNINYNFVRHCCILLLPLVFVACANSSKINNPNEVAILTSPAPDNGPQTSDVIADSFGSSASTTTLLFADRKFPKEVRITNRRRSDLAHEVSKVEILGCNNSDEVAATTIEEGTIIGEIFSVSVASNPTNSESCLFEHLSINIVTQNNAIDEDDLPDTASRKSAIIRTYQLSFNPHGILAIRNNPQNNIILE